MTRSQVCLQTLNQETEMIGWILSISEGDQKYTQADRKAGRQTDRQFCGWCLE